MATSIVCIPTKRELKYLRELFAQHYTQTTILRDSLLGTPAEAVAQEVWHAVNKANERVPFVISTQLRGMLAECIADPKGKLVRKRARARGLAGW